MRTTTRWITLALVMLSLTGLGFAQQQGRMRQPGPPHARLEALLDLTDAQQASLKAIHAEQRQAAEPILEELRGIHDAIETGLESDAPDATALGEKLIAAHAARTRLEQLHRAGRERLVSLLTDEQRQKLEAFEKEHGPAGGPGMRRHMGGPGHAGMRLPLPQ
jgi:Spy/CpxP family protein refolding chaperone